MKPNVRNLAGGVVATAPSPATSGTSITLASGHGANLPDPPFYATVTPPGNLSTPMTAEIVYVTDRPGDADTYTIERNKRESGGAKSIDVGWIFTNGIYTQDMSGGGYVAQDDPPDDITLLWYDTDDEGVPLDAASAIVDRIYPVGSEYSNFTNSTNPATLLAMPWSTWVAVEGRVVVGLDSGQTEFDTALETGGSKTHTLTTTEMPAHNHPMRFGDTAGGDGTGYRFSNTTGTGTAPFNPTNVGGGAAHNNLQPYIVAYVWRRTV